MRFERGTPKVRVLGLGESEEREIVKTVREVAELAYELKRIAEKSKGTTRAKVIPLRKGHLKK